MTEFLHRLTPHLFPPSTHRRSRPHRRYIKTAANSTDDHGELASDSSSGSPAAPRSSLSSLDADPGKGATEDTQSNAQSEEAPSFHRHFGEGEGSSSDNSGAKRASALTLLPQSVLYEPASGQRGGVTCRPTRPSSITQSESPETSLCECQSPRLAKQTRNLQRTPFRRYHVEWTSWNRISALPLTRWTGDSVKCSRSRARDSVTWQRALIMLLLAIIGLMPFKKISVLSYHFFSRTSPIFLSRPNCISL
ncbi:hypothetical protein EDD85DRAFT_846207 [Armillaria nabsnona]|nr:hypothetical protein EDD85DRAFT_846207 [Armillaria nabsnona]